MNVIRALDDPELFGGMFDAPSWAPWRVFLKALEALPMDEGETAVYRHHTGRNAPPTKRARYAELVVGRRGGKSRILATIATYLACVLDHRPFIVPGETPVVAIIAKDREQAKVIKNYISGFAREIPAFADMIEVELAESVRLSNGVVVEVHTASIGAPRGRTFLAVLCDETAFWPMGDSANPDVEVINAVRPGLSTIPYSLLVIASSPYAKRGILYTNYVKYFGKDEAPVLVWQGTTEEMNSTLIGDPLIGEMFAEDPDRASAEFGAQFRSDIVAFITREAIEDVVATGMRELPPGRGITYTAFVDPSGGSADSFTLAIGHMEGDGTAVLDAIREARPPFSPDAVVEEFAALLKSYGISRMHGDAYAGEWPRERFATHGIAYEVSKKPKSAVYLEFLPALNGHRVRLLDIPRLISQLMTLERRTARGGRDSIDHETGAHDDVANAACGCLVQIIEDRRPALINRNDLLAAEQQPVEHLHLFPSQIYATTWVGIDGMCGYVIFSHSNVDTVPLILLDFDHLPWSGGVITHVVRRMHELCDEVTAAALARNRRCNPSVFVHVPGQLVDAAVVAVKTVFGAQLDAMFRFGRLDRHIDVTTIDPVLCEDPVRLMLNAGVHVSGGRVKLSAAALARSAELPLFGSLSLKAGEDVMCDVLRVAMLIAIAGLDPMPKRTEGAAMRFR